MILISYLLTILLLLFEKSYAQNDEKPGPSQLYEEMHILDEPNNFILYWTIKNNEITFEIHVKTTGWFGFGLVSNENNNHLDIVIASINNATKIGHMSDRHTFNSMIAKSDDHLDWIPVLLKAHNDHFILKVHRKLKICNRNFQDLDFQHGLNKFIFMKNDNSLFNSNDDIDLAKVKHHTSKLQLDFKHWKDSKDNKVIINYL